MTTFAQVSAKNTALIDLLKAEGLPTSDLSEPGRIFWQLSTGGDVIGYVGLEPYGKDALLRSLVVSPEFKGVGYGATLVGEAAERARETGHTTLWLLTTTAKAFFEHLGWQICDRARAPEALQQSTEFSRLCPSSAICMSLELKPD